MREEREYINAEASEVITNVQGVTPNDAESIPCLRWSREDHFTWVPTPPLTRALEHAYPTGAEQLRA